MDIRSIGNATPSGQLIADKVANAQVPVAKPVSAPVAAFTESAVNPPAKAPTAEEVNKAVKDINQSLQAQSQNIEFTVDKDSDKIVVKVVDSQTKVVLRQIPTEEALEISKSLDKLQGLLIKQQA